MPRDAGLQRWSRLPGQPVRPRPAQERPAGL